MPQPHVLILGIRGVPAAHGGFETFAERLALHLVERGWRVTVYCQAEVAAVTRRFTTDTWRGVERVTIEVARDGAMGTIEFDWHAVRHAGSQDGVCLVLRSGGFETFAERLALHLVERGWRVTVYCQAEVAAVTRRFTTDTWRGVERVTIEVARDGAMGTIEFDWHAVRHAGSQDGVCLVL